MKIYCSCCDKVQPVRIDNCRDAKTNEPFQDIVCADCHLVIAAGTGIKREWVGLTNDEVNNLAAGCHLGNSVQDAIYKAAAKLKEKNHDLL